MLKIKSLYFFPFSLIIINSFAQKNVKDTVISSSSISVNYSPIIPTGDLKDRFGTASDVGVNFNYKTSKNYIFTIEGTFIFGNKINDKNVLTPFQSSDGFIFDRDGLYSNVQLYQRGYTTTLNIGKIFPMLGPNPNSGIMIRIGGGFLQHKILVVNTGNAVDYLSNKDYVKGLDKLANGLFLKEFVGYHYFGNNKLANFYAGFEFGQGLTQGRRTWNFVDKSGENPNRFDGMMGFRVGWILPFYKRQAQDFYYY